MPSARRVCDNRVRSPAHLFPKLTKQDATFITWEIAVVQILYNTSILSVKTLRMRILVQVIRYPVRGRMLAVGCFIDASDLVTTGSNKGGIFFYLQVLEW